MTDTEFKSPIDGIPLLTMSETGAVPEARLKDPASLRAIYAKFCTDDEKSALQRDATQRLLDGEPPYSEEELIASGQPDTTNINVDGAAETLEKALAPIYALVQSTEDLVSVSTLFGADEDKADYNTILSAEISRTIRENPTHPFQTARLGTKHIWDGMAIGHWQDELDWRFRSAGLGQFYFPRKAFACEDEVEVAICYEEMDVTKLYQKIKNEENATKRGWSVPDIKRAIQKASPGGSAHMDWEQLSEQLKNNDVSINVTTPTIKIIHGFIREFSGKVSHYMTTETAMDKDEKFLYCRRENYASNTEAFILFPYGIGTNTKIHGIRGLGYKIYPTEQQRNRSYSRLIDQSNLASSLMMQAENEEALATIGLQYYGNLAVIPPECKVVPYAAPDLQRTVMPVIQMMEQIRAKRTEGYNSDSAFQGDQRKTKGEVFAKLEQNASLSDTQLDFWNAPYQRLLQQMVRRMSRKTYVTQDPGGREVADLHLRLVKAGVPLEALFQLDIKATKLVKAIGAGSPSARTLAFQQVAELVPHMDDVGQAWVYRQRAIIYLGVDGANQCFPRNGVKRTTLDTNVAILENGQLLEGNPIPIQSSDKHLAHAREHMKPLIEGFQAEQQGQVPIEEIGPRLSELYNHTTEHVQRISGDPSSVEEAAEMRQILQQVGEVVSNGIKAAQKQAEKQAAEGAQEQPGTSAKTLADVEMSREKNRRDEETHQMRLRQMQETAATQDQIKDAQAAAEIIRRNKIQKATPTK